MTKQGSHFQKTLYTIHNPATWRQWINEKKPLSGQSLSIQCTWILRIWNWLSSWSPHWRTVHRDRDQAQRDNRNKVYRWVHIHPQHQPQNTNSLRDMIHNTSHKVFERELAVKLYPTDVELGTSANRNPRVNQVTNGKVRIPVSAYD